MPDIPKLAGGLNALIKGGEEVAPAVKTARGFSPRLLESTTNKMLEDILANNPKLTPEAAFKKARDQATDKLAWEKEKKPALVKQYGELARASYAKSNPQKMQNTPAVVQERIRKANEFLDQPTEPWTPPRPELQAFDRSSIKDALEGFPNVEQSAFPRDIPTRASTSHVEELYTDPVNRELIKKQIKRGLPLGGESFYASLYPVKQAVLEAGMPAEKFEQWIHSLAPASARNSIMNEMAVGQFLRDMNARGIPLTKENVRKGMEEFKNQYGVGLPLMYETHGKGVANVLEGGLNLREMNKANIPTNYKIPTYGSQKAGDFGKSIVLDVHEAAGQTQGSRYHPYFKEQGGFGNTEYNIGEQGMMEIANELGIPGGMAQAGRWFGGGELTGLRSPRGDALDLLEKQVAYTLKQQGKQPNPAMIRQEVLNQIKTGEGTLLPWYKGEAMPDVRQTGLQRKDGGSVEPPPFHDFEQIINRKDGGTVSTFEQRLKSALSMAMGGEVSDNTSPDMTDGGNVNYGGQYAHGGGVRMGDGGSYPPKKDVPAMTPQQYLDLLALQPKLGLQSEKQIKAKLEEQYRKEKEEGFGTPQARIDRAIKTVTPALGAVADVGNLAANIPRYVTEGVSAAGNYAMSKIPSMSKPASVLDTEGTGDRVAKYPLQGLPEFDPFYGSSQMQQHAREAGLMGESESPVYDTAMAFLSPYGATKAPSAIKGGLNMAKPVMKEAGDIASRAAIPIQRPFTPATFTVEGTAPDLGQGTSYGFRQGLNDVLIGEPNLGRGRNKVREGQGTYVNTSGDLELNPMLAIDVPRAGSIGNTPSANKALRQQIGQMGVDLNQEAMAGHRFLPLMTNNIKDASAMLIKTKEGLNAQEIKDLAKVLGGDMVVTHNPKLGGVVVYPFGAVEKGQIPEEFLKAQSVAGELLGKRGKVQFGVSDFNKDRLFMEKVEGDYQKAGAKPMSKEQQEKRSKIQGVEKFMFPESTSGIPGQVKASPIGGLQPWSRGENYPTNVIGIGNADKTQYQPVNFLTGKQGSRYDKYSEAENARAQMLDEWHRTLPARAR